MKYALYLLFFGLFIFPVSSFSQNETQNNPVEKPVLSFKKNSFVPRDTTLNKIDSTERRKNKPEFSYKKNYHNTNEKIKNEEKNPPPSKESQTKPIITNKKER